MNKKQLLLILISTFFSVGTAQSASDAATQRYVQKFKDGLKAEPRCEKFKSRFDATLDKGTLVQGVFMNAFMKEYEAAKAEKCVKPTPENGLRE